ncbi:hypothetical protein [Hymenobacter sp. B81]|uniref:hypothetical protein n=1 Tax=Hymenobacter sp. B81 TaxID=3344878 RepID=UPI0037DC4CDB
MENMRTLTADTEAALWNQLTTDLHENDALLDYAVRLDQGGHTIFLAIDIDLGGGFEGGFESTTLLAPLAHDCALRFSIHEQNWMNELGKLLGLEDIELGYPAVDDAFIIKTNDPDALRAVLADEAIRALLLRHRDFRLTLGPNNDTLDGDICLAFTKDEALTDPEQLREAYQLVYSLLQAIGQPARAGQLA